MDDATIVGVSAAVSSFLSGLLGIGGGLVLTPLLLYLPPVLALPLLPVKLITGLTMVQALSGSLFGLVRHGAYGNVSTRTLRLMGPLIAVASFGGALLSSRTSDQLILLVFALVAAAGAVALIVPAPARPDQANMHPGVTALALVIVALLGVFGGIVGIGGVAFIIPALIHLVRLPPRTAIGTSLGLGLCSATGGLVGKAATAQIDPFLGLIVFVCALVASPLGATISVRTPVRTLTLALAAVVMLTAVRIALSVASSGM